MTAPVRPALVEGLQPLSDRYDLVLCDIWGVLHNGVKAYEAAGEALTRFREGGGHVVLVSNAPRPGASVGTQLDGFGVPRSAYDAIVTSGDLTRLAIEERVRSGGASHRPAPRPADVRGARYPLRRHRRGRLRRLLRARERRGARMRGDYRPRLDAMLQPRPPDDLRQSGSARRAWAQDHSLRGRNRPGLRGDWRPGLLCGQAPPSDL